MAIVGDSPRLVKEVARRLAHHWPVIAIGTWSEAESADVAGIVVTGTKKRRRTRRVPVITYGRRDLRELNAFTAQVLAYHYTGIASVAEIMRGLVLEHDLTVKQAELVCVHCVELSRGEILTRLDISENTLKTRIRLLSRILNANAGMNQIVVRILRSAAQNKEERARGERAVPLPPKIAAPEAPSRENAARARKKGRPVRQAHRARARSVSEEGSQEPAPRK